MRPLTIAAVAKRLNLSTDRVRQLDAELEPERTESGVRLYRPDVVDAFAAKRAAMRAAPIAPLTTRNR